MVGVFKFKRVLGVEEIVKFHGKVWVFFKFLVKVVGN